MSLINNSRLTVFWELFEGDIETAIEVAELFCSHVTELMGDINSAIESQDMATLGNRLHRLKGSIGLLGFMEESNYICDLENNMTKHKASTGQLEYEEY